MFVLIEGEGVFLRLMIEGIMLCYEKVVVDFF